MRKSKVLVSGLCGRVGATPTMLQKTGGVAQELANLLMERATSKPRHQSLQNCPSSSWRTSDWVRAQSLEIAEVMVLTMIRATRRAKDPLWLCSSRAQRTRHIAPMVVIRR